MSFKPVYDLTSIQQFVDGAPFGDPLSPSRVTLLGSAPGMVTAKIYVPGLIDEDDTEGGWRWIEADTVTGATVTDNPRGGIVIEGVSQHMIEDVGLPLVDATVRFEVEVKECAGCR